jgi:DNA gyrase subunit A
MATNIPPHNLTEVINGTIALAKKSDMEVSDLMKYISGPDFPTAAFIYGRSGIKDAYETGRGMIKLRAKAEIEDTGTKTRIIVSEIPYMVNKSKLIETIADLVRDKTIEGISNIKDESNRHGIRVVIDIKRDANANVILNQLFKHTQMETSFGINNLALVDGVPRTLSLKEMLQCFIDHRFIVVTNRCDFEMKKAAEREHILTGFITAMKDIDAVVSLIRRAENTEAAKISLMGAKFNFSEEQAKAILDLKLARLTSMERSKVEAERAELIKQIAYLKEVLADPAKRTAIVIKELEEVKAKFGDARRTQIKDDLGEITNEQLIPEETVAVIMTNTGYIKRIPIDVFRTQKRGGMGASGITTKDGDFIRDMFVSSTHDYVMFFTNKGRVYSVKVYDIESPQSKQSMGRAIVNLLNLQQGEKVVVAIPVHEFDENHYAMFATKLGTVKKTALSDFANIRSTGIIAIGLDPEDELIGVRITNGKNEILLASANGQSIRFSEEDVRSMGRAAAGVIGMRLQRDDKVIGMEVMAAKESGVTVLTICENGFGKRTDVDEYRIQGRGGQGVINIQTTRRNGAVVSIANVKDNDQFAIMTKKGIMIRTPVAGVRMIGRNCQGVRAIKLDDDDLVATVTKIASEDIVE